MSAAEDQRKTQILIKYKENATRQMAQQHEAMLKKLFDTADLLDSELADEVLMASVFCYLTYSYIHLKAGVTSRSSITAVSPSMRMLFSVSSISLMLALDVIMCPYSHMV